ncbi:hypothetical protein UlMin_023622 [Ulmus minor]
MAYVSMGEAHRRITDYLNRLSDVVSSQDGTSLKILFSLSSNSPLSSLSPMLVNQSERFSQLGDIVLPLFHTLQNYRLGNSTDAYEAFEKSTNFFIQEFRNWDSAWALEALYVVAYQIRVHFYIMLCDGPKRVGALYVSCQLFKIYFELGTVHLCRSVIKSIETARIFEFEEFPKRDKVTYMYYTVHLEVCNENFPALVPMNWFLGFHHWSVWLLRNFFFIFQCHYCYIDSKIWLTMAQLKLTMVVKLFASLLMLVKYENILEVELFVFENCLKTLTIKLTMTFLKRYFRHLVIT